MSFDFYLLPASVVHLNAELARAFIGREDRGFLEIPKAHDPECECKKRELADVLVRLKPNYRKFEIDFKAIAEWEKISVEEARRKYRYIEMNGRSKPAYAQCIFFEHHVVVHWYSGTSEAEMDAILFSLSVTGNFVVYDPQANEVYDLASSDESKHDRVPPGPRSHHADSTRPLAITNSIRHELLSVLAELSGTCPEMRFGQLIANLSALAKAARRRGPLGCRG